MIRYPSLLPGAVVGYVQSMFCRPAMHYRFYAEHEELFKRVLHDLGYEPQSTFRFEQSPSIHRRWGMSTPINTYCQVYVQCFAYGSGHMYVNASVTFRPMYPMMYYSTLDMMRPMGWHLSVVIDRFEEELKRRGLMVSE